MLTAVEIQDKLMTFLTFQCFQDSNRTEVKNGNYTVPDNNMVGKDSALIVLNVDGKKFDILIIPRGDSD